jgi:hypothetical protein
MSYDTRPKLHKTGALWRPRNPDSRALASGTVTVNGYKQKIVILPNDHKAKPTDPDFTICASDRPERDPYSPRAGRDEDDPDQAPARADDDRRYDDQAYDGEVERRARTRDAAPRAGARPGTRGPW